MNRISRCLIKTFDNSSWHKFVSSGDYPIIWCNKKPIQLPTPNGRALENFHFRKLKSKTKILFLFSLLHSGLLLGQNDEYPHPLFESDDILEIKISLNVNEVIYDTEVRDAHEATLSYTNSAGEEEVFNVKLTVRGNARTKVCRFPPMQVNFKKKKLSIRFSRGKIKLNW